MDRADKPNQRGLAVMIYVQWLGSWLESYPYYEDYEPSDVKDVSLGNSGGRLFATAK